MPVPISQAARVVISLTSAATAALALTVASAALQRPVADAQSGNGNCPNTAAAAHGWGEPNRADNFDGPDRSASGRSMTDPAMTGTVAARATRSRRPTAS